MAIIRNLVVKIAADISSLSRGLQSAQKQIQKVSLGFSKVGTKLSATITAPIIALGVSAINTSQQFEQSMANAASVASATGEELDEMKKLARDMGAKTVFSASQAADALYYMASAGYKVDDMAQSIEATLNLASATQSDLAFTTDTVVATLNQFGLGAAGAERVANVFAAAIGASQATLDKLGNSMSYVGPVAHSLGWGIEETTGALSVLYDAGYDGSMAGTSLRQSLVALMNPTSAAKKVFEELGVDLEKLDPTTNSFADILDILNESGITTAQAMQIFGARAGPGMLALLSAGGDAVRGMTDSITDTTAATSMAEKQLNTLQGQWKILKSEVQEIALQFGDVLIPIIRQLLTKYISPMIAKIMGLSKGTKRNIVTIALLAAAIGPLLLIIGKLISGISLIIKVGSLLFSKIGIIIAIIAVLGLIIKNLWDTNDDFRYAIIDIWDKIKSVVLNVFNAIKNWWDKSGQQLVTKTLAALRVIWNVLSEVFGKILALSLKVWNAVKDVVIETVEAIQEFWSEHGEAIWETVKTLFTRIWEIVQTAFDIISDAVVKFLAYVEPICENLKALFASLWNTIVELYETLKPIFDLIGGIILTLYGIACGVISGIISSIGPFIQAVIDIGKAVLEVVQMVCAILRGDWSDAWEHMKNIAGNMWSAIKNIFIGIWEFIKGFCSGIGTFFGDLGDNISAIFKRAWEGISGFFVNIWEGIKSVCGWIWDKLTGLFSNIGDYFKELWKDAFNWGKNLIQNIGDGIKKAWSWVVDGVKSIGQSIKDFLGFGSPTKKGPGRTADKWIPNLLKMMENDFYKGAPNIQRATLAVANSLNYSSPIQAVVGQGSSQGDDIVNGLLQGLSMYSYMTIGEKKEIILEIDGQTLARIMMPKLNKEYKRNGIVLREV